MLSIQISDIKTFMKELLMSERFDNYLLVSGSITTYNTLDVDGRIRAEFFGDEYDISPMYGYDYTPWKQSKDLFLSRIKGKHTPLSFKFVLKLMPKQATSILSEATDDARNNTSALLLNIKYDEHGLSVITGTSSIEFILDKSAEDAWDNHIRHSFSAWE